jgi:pyruvate,water dikinase
MIRKDVYWLEEIGREYNELVGKKSANLAEMLKIEGINVPPGFAISLGAFEKFIKGEGIVSEIKAYIEQTFPQGLDPTSIQQVEEASLGLKNIIESKGIPSDLKEDIAIHYRALCDKCGANDVAVSIRSAGAKSHPGQYETYLNVNGYDQVLEKVRKVWSSIYNTRSLIAAIRQAIPVESCPAVGVCVLKMVNARAAGVCLTSNPKSGDASEAVVESNWGLGESVVSGSATPDSFVVDKVKMRLKKGVAGQKEVQVVAREGAVVVEQIPPEKKSALSLSEEELIRIVELAKKLEQHFGVPQDIEWAIDSDLPVSNNVVLLQTRPQVGIPEQKNETDKILDMMARRYRM